MKRKAKKCLRKSAIPIKVFLTICGLAGLGCMAYDMKHKRDCDLHFFTSYVVIVTSGLALIGAVVKFGYEIKEKINCFDYLTDDESSTGLDSGERTPLGDDLHSNYSSTP